MIFKLELAQECEVMYFAYLIEKKAHIIIRLLTLLIFKNQKERNYKTTSMLEDWSLLSIRIVLEWNFNIFYYNHQTVKMLKILSKTYWTSITENDR